MYKQTMAALGGLVIDLVALSAATTIETAEATCHVTQTVCSCVAYASRAGRDSCLRAGDNVAAWRMLKKHQLETWSEDGGAATPAVSTGPAA